MSEPLDERLSSPDDFQLCSALFTRLVNWHGPKIDASAIPETHRVVLLVWHAFGIIGNGGFNFLFEGSFDGDPHFHRTAAAFRAIGCNAASRAFDDALRLFPDSKPPTDIERRLQIYGKGGGTARHDIDSRFFAASDAITASLAGYIRRNSEGFAGLDDPRPERPPDAAQNDDFSAPEETEANGIGAMAQLPHWFRVAIAVHFARRVLPLFDVHWPEAPPTPRNAVVDALAAAQRSAGQAAPVEDVRAAVDNAIMASGAALRTLYGIPATNPEPGPVDGNAARLAANVAAAARCAAEAAAAPAHDSARHAWQSILLSISATPGADDLMYEVVGAMEVLRELAEEHGWNDDTPAPARRVARLFGAPPESNKPWWKFW